MKKIKQINKNLVYIIAGLLTLISSFSYAYFNNRVVGTEDSTTITGNSGIMQIQYDGGPAINVSSFFPSATAFATKNIYGNWK